jgi:hypothetical protein
LLEFLDLIDREKISVVQLDVERVGEFTEAKGVYTGPPLSPAGSKHKFNTWVLSRDTLLIVRVGGGPLVMEEEACVPRGADALVSPWLVVELKEPGQIVPGALIRKMQRTLVNAEVVFDKPKNAAEVVVTVIDITARRMGGNDNQRNTKAVLVISLWLLQDRWQLMVVPASPVIPGDKDGGIAQQPLLLSHVVLLPMALTIDATHEGPPPSLLRA